MAMKRGRPGSPAVRSGRVVGPDYPETNFRAPWACGMDSDFGDRSDKSVFSDAGTTFEGGGAPLNKGSYDKNWEGR